jgi:hypothetical protein
MRTVFHLCLLAACAISSGLALAAPHGHRPNATAARSAPAGGDAGKSTAVPAGPAEAPPPAAGGNAADMAAPIDTSITVNQGHRALSAKESAEKKVTTALGRLILGQAKPHPQPVHPFSTRAVPPHRNAVGSIIAHPTSHPAASRATAATTAPPTPPARPDAASATPAPHEAAGTPVPAPKGPAAIAAEHGAAALKAATAAGPSITGTGMKRPEAATAAVGGPAKAVAAAVGGASVRPKHP